MAFAEEVIADKGSRSLARLQRTRSSKHEQTHDQSSSLLRKREEQTREQEKLSPSSLSRHHDEEEDDIIDLDDDERRRRRLSFLPISHTDCVGDKVAIDILFKTDLNPTETTSVYLVDPNVGYRDILWSGLNTPLHEYTQGKCLSRDRCYLFVILDQGGDGLCCSHGMGGYLVHYDHTTVAAGDASDFKEIIIPLGPPEGCQPYMR